MSFCSKLARDKIAALQSYGHLRHGYFQLIVNTIFVAAGLVVPAGVPRETLPATTAKRLILFLELVAPVNAQDKNKRLKSSGHQAAKPESRTQIFQTTSHRDERLNQQYHCV